MQRRQLAFFKMYLLRMHKILNGNRLRQGFDMWRNRCCIWRWISAARKVFFRRRNRMLRYTFGQWMFFVHCTRRFMHACVCDGIRADVSKRYFCASTSEKFKQLCAVRNDEQCLPGCCLEYLLYGKIL